jgi:hypothetical protein
MIIVYGVFALCGLVGPWIFNLQFIHAHGGFSVSEFVAECFTAPATRSLSIDITVAALAWIAWMVGEARRLGMRHWWIYIVLVFGVAFGFACPFFLFMRERHLRGQRAAPARG